MTIETTVFTFQISNTFEEWAKIFDSPEIDEFHKTAGLTPLYRGKGLTDSKEVIVIHQAPEGNIQKFLEVHGEWVAAQTVELSTVDLSFWVSSLIKDSCCV